MKDNAGYEVAAVRKALQVLCEFDSATPMLTVSEISRRLTLPKSTAHNLLKTLASLDFVRQDRETRGFRLGPRLFELGHVYSESMQLIAAALPEMRRLADQTKETVKLATLSGGELLVLEGIESPYQLHTRADVGRRAPLHCTGLGKALLACLPSPDIREIVAQRGLAPFTRYTITSLARLEQELEQIRLRGYALDREENEAGVCCAGSPIGGLAGQAIAALSVSGPTIRLKDDVLISYATMLTTATAAVSLYLR